jgi:hypothetical protein
MEEGIVTPERRIGATAFLGPVASRFYNDHLIDFNASPKEAE